MLIEDVCGEQRKESRGGREVDRLRERPVAPPAPEGREAVRGQRGRDGDTVGHAGIPSR